MSEQLKFAHYMLKEIYENPAAVRDTISPRVAPDGRIQFEGLRISEDELRNIKQIHILASGTSRPSCAPVPAGAEPVCKRTNDGANHS